MTDLDKYTTEDLKTLASELLAEIRRREFAPFREQALPYKQLCLEEYASSGMIAAIKLLRSFIKGSSIANSKELISEWVDTNPVIRVDGLRCPKMKLSWHGRDYIPT